MQRLALAGHYGRNVDLDLCRSCDLVWFDDIETARLSGAGAARADRPRWPRRYDLPHETLRADAALPALRRHADDRRTTSRAGAARCSCSACGATARTSRSPQFLEEKGLLRPMSLARSRQAAARPRPDRLRQLRRRDRQGRRALPVLPLDAQPARRRPPRACARSARHDSSRTPLPGVQARAGRDAMRRLRRGAAAGRDDELRAVRRDARDHQPARGQRARCRRSRRRCARAAARPPPEVVKRRARRARRRSAAAARVGGGMEARSRRARGRASTSRSTGRRSFERAVESGSRRGLIALAVWVAVALWRWR